MSARKRAVAASAFVLIVLAASLIVLLAPSRALALQAKAQVDRPRVSLGESFTLTVTVSDGSGKVDLEPLELSSDFKITGRSTGTSISLINGDFSKISELRLTLRPKREGRLTIPALTVGEGNDAVTTASIPVTVQSLQAELQEDGETPDIFMRATVSDTSPFVGESIVYTLQIFTRIRFANPQLEDSGFEGFSAKQYPDQNTYSTAVAGKRYEVIEVRFLLAPLQAGEADVGPLSLHCDLMTQQRNTTSRFDAFFAQPRLTPKIIQAPALKMSVRPLPAYTQDIPFSGLIGSFTLEVEPTSQSVAPGESAALSLRVSGSGNVMDSPMPQLEIPDTFKVYNDGPVEDVRLEEEGYVGSKSFDCALVPLESGEFFLGPAVLSYFDPEKEEYLILSSQPLKVAVAAGEQELKRSETFISAPQTVVKSAPVSKQKVEFVQKDILPLQRDLAALQDQRAMSAMFFSALLLAPAAVFCIAGLARKKLLQGEDACRLLSRRAEELVRAARQEDVRTEALSLCAKAVVAAVRSRNGQPGESLTYEEAESLLRDHGRDDLAGKVRDLLQDLDAARYGAASLDRSGLEGLLSRTSALVKELCV